LKSAGVESKTYFVLSFLHIFFTINGKQVIPFIKSKITYAAERIRHTTFSLPNAATNIIGTPIRVRNKERLATGIFINFSFSVMS
jgi:hypothetical protein